MAKPSQHHKQEAVNKEHGNKLEILIFPYIGFLTNLRVTVEKPTHQCSSSKVLAEHVLTLQLFTEEHVKPAPHGSLKDMFTGTWEAFVKVVSAVIYAVGLTVSENKKKVYTN